MALGAITTGGEVGRSGGPILAMNMSFLGDGAYSAGGTAGFEALVQAAIGAGFELLAIVASDCGGYIPVYDKAADKLKVYEQTDTATAPLIETVTADLSGTTFNILVIAE